MNNDSIVYVCHFRIISKFVKNELKLFQNNSIDMKLIPLFGRKTFLEGDR
jgi:hypothetical protein